jgi:hypothetical protein
MNYKLFAGEVVYEAMPFEKGSPVLDFVFHPVSGSDSGELVEVHAHLDCPPRNPKDPYKFSPNTVYRRSRGWQSSGKNIHPLLPHSLNGRDTLFGVPVEHKIDYEEVASRILRFSGIEDAAKYLGAA